MQCELTAVKLTADRENKNIIATAAELWIVLFLVPLTQPVEGGTSKAKVKGLIPKKYTN